MTPRPLAAATRTLGLARLILAALWLPHELRAARQLVPPPRSALPPQLAVLADESCEILYRPDQDIDLPASATLSASTAIAAAVEGDSPTLGAGAPALPQAGTVPPVPALAQQPLLAGATATPDPTGGE